MGSRCGVVVIAPRVQWLSPRSAPRNTSMVTVAMAITGKGHLASRPLVGPNGDADMRLFVVRGV